MKEKRKDDASVSKDGASVADEIAALEREGEVLSLQQQAVIAQIRKLRADEDPSSGKYFAQEIFQLSQEKLRLATEMEFRRCKANRLRLGNEPTGLLQ
ncbi:MAG: hypothetical protein KKE73_07755 [Proteobacteria bacterium]|nr:hypothetical protein [Pseudomonadota bacterium]